MPFLASSGKRHLAGPEVGNELADGAPLAARPGDRVPAQLSRGRGWASPESVARAIFGAVEEEEDIFPDPMSQSVAESWRNSAAKALEHKLAALAQGISNEGD